MRRLITLYTATGQLPILRAAIAREKQNYTDCVIANLVKGAKLAVRDQEDLQMGLTGSGIGVFERIERFRDASRHQQWKVLLFPLQVPAGSGI